MPRIELPEEPEIAYGSDLLSHIAGHDTEADSRQRNREFVSCGNHNRGKGCRFVSVIPQPLAPPLAPS